jgi:uncharacterized membrane protein
MGQVLDATTVIGLFLVAILAIAGIVRFRAVTKKNIRRKPLQDF